MSLASQAIRPPCSVSASGLISRSSKSSCRAMSASRTTERASRAARSRGNNRAIPGKIASGVMASSTGMRTSFADCSTFSPPCGATRSSSRCAVPSTRTATKISRAIGTASSSRSGVSASSRVARISRRAARKSDNSVEAPHQAALAPAAFENLRLQQPVRARRRRSRADFRPVQAGCCAAPRYRGGAEWLSRRPRQDA